MRRKNKLWGPEMGERLEMSRFIVNRLPGVCFDKAEGEPAGDGGAADAGGSGKNAPGAKKLTAEELQTELEKVQKALKDANHESADRRKKLEAFEGEETKRKLDEEQRKLAEMSDLQKAQKAIEDLKVERDQIKQQRLQDQIESEIKDMARSLKFRDPLDALRMIDRSKIVTGDDGKITGAKELLEDLAKAKPYLLDSGDPSITPKGTPKPKSKQPGQPSEQPPAKPLVSF